MNNIIILPTEKNLRYLAEQGFKVVARQPELTPFNAAMKRKKDAEAKKQFVGYDFDPEAA